MTLASQVWIVANGLHDSESIACRVGRTESQLKAMRMENDSRKEMRETEDRAWSVEEGPVCSFAGTTAFLSMLNVSLSNQTRTSATRNSGCFRRAGAAQSGAEVSLFRWSSWWKSKLVKQSRAKH